MITPLLVKRPVILRNIGFVLFLMFCFFSVSSYSQDLPPTSANNQLIPAGSYVIPMDNTNQALVSPFNLKAYGLADKLLQNSVPLMWAIKSGKAKDAVDFSVAAKRIAPSAVASATKNFSAGPFIIHRDFAAQALPFITAFGNNVAVYETTVDVTVDIRYTLTHKPLIAVGLANSNNDEIHKDLFDFALIPEYVDVDDSTVNASTCVTLVSQPHVEATNFISNYKTFVQSGGNLLLQCHAVETYENAAAGRFQTTLGWDRDDVSSTLAYPNADMPFSQFIGIVDPSPGGYEEDWQLSSGALQNGTFISLQGTGGDSDHYAATVSKLYNSGPGGMVFELGGHDYGAGGSTLSSINGQRMVLNAVFQPPTRPVGCGFTLAFPSVIAYKSVKLTTDILSNGVVNPFDTITWQITYVNIGTAATTNFQINDVLPTGVTISSVGAQTVTVTGAGSSATKNNGYTGASAGAVSDLLAGGAVLAPGGKIVVEIPTLVLPTAPSTILNQSKATGLGIAAGGVFSDNVDNTTGGLLGGATVPAGSISQTQVASIDPAAVNIVAAPPTAANVSISGRVMTPEGQGISRASITIFNTNTQETTVVTTNSFGNYFADGLPAGDFYILTVSHRKFEFANNIQTLNLEDNLTDVNFISGNGILNTKPSVPGKFVTKETLLSFQSKSPF